MDGHYLRENSPKGGAVDDDGFSFFWIFSAASVVFTICFSFLLNCCLCTHYIQQYSATAFLTTTRVASHNNEEYIIINIMYGGWMER